ncbi:hypothetical protein LCGC14_1009430 [marine sediment metagenome]|uniref:Uncharacterized protein n=1 Tax=marine sediment metagenome TaxID=412755 RepID=A0A0F9N574_9ZZZZ|nr:hypothetical protein [Candidatus Aminicenantes bacterium]
MTKTARQIMESVTKGPEKCVVCGSCDCDWKLKLTGSPPFYTTTCNWCGSKWIECLGFTHIEGLEIGQWELENNES